MMGGMWTVEELERLPIKKGNHEKPNGVVEACAMEAAYLRWAIRQGWPKKKIVSGWTDKLDCVDLYIGSFVRNWNDSISDDEARTRIFSPDLLDRLPGTKGGDVLMLRRMWMGVDWDIRVRTPAFLRLAKLDAIASAVAALPVIDSQKRLNEARATLMEAQKQGTAAWDAAWAAAWAAARDAAWAAARAAARDAARAAALAAAWDAAWDAALAAARERLASTVSDVQVSAKDLIVRMCELR
jgi:hypothetical protein